MILHPKIGTRSEKDQHQEYCNTQKDKETALVNIQSSNDYGEVSYLHPEARKQKSVNKNESMYLI